MGLPKLQMKELDKNINCFAGLFLDPCETCSLKDECIGCRGRTDCRQRTCIRGCNTCGGSAADMELDRVKTVPATCCKSPLKDLFLDQVKKEHYDFTKRKKIVLNRRAVIVTQGSAGRAPYPLYLPDAAAIAVNLRHVWSGHGWFSRDMRDYLRVESKDTKLILLTTTLDDVLERAWEAEVYNEKFSDIGFDYWHALDFSEYNDTSHHYNIWTGYRTLCAIESSRAHFSFVPPHAASRHMKGFNSSVWVDVAKAIPNLYIHTQWVKVNSSSGRKHLLQLLANIQRWIKLVNVDLSLWFMGVTTYPLAYAIAKTFPKNDLHFLAVNPWIAAHKGSEFTVAGKLKKSKLPKPELILLNQQHYEKLISNAVHDARKI